MLDQFEDFPFQFIKNNSLKNNEISFTRVGSLIPLSESINNEDKLFEDLIIDLFLDEYSFIKNSILNCKKFLQTSEVDVVVWGNPPCLNSGMAVTARYLMESGIPVVGYQHGGSYGIQEMLVGHHDSDYQHCTHFFSYGFTAEDVYETTGDYPNCEIIPVGSLKVSSSVQRTKTNSLSKERIDVLYITTNQIPYLMRDSFSYQLPKLIIDLLGSQVNMKSVVKLFPGASKFNYSHYEYSKSFQNLLVYSRGGVFDILRKFDPLLIIMCYPSTPLYEVLDSKASIFLLNDPLSPFSASSKSLLEQRVHLFDTFEQLKTSFELFRLNQLNFKGGLEFSKKFAQSYPLFEHVSILSGQLKSISDQRFI